MGLELVPREIVEIPTREIACRLQQEFACFEADNGKGMQAAIARAKWIERASPRVFLGRHEDALRHAARLRALSEGEAVAIRFGDEQERLLAVVLIPGEPIRFSFASKEDEIDLRALVDRCARVLHCAVERF